MTPTSLPSMNVAKYDSADVSASETIATAAIPRPLKALPRSHDEEDAEGIQAVFDSIDARPRRSSGKLPTSAQPPQTASHCYLTSSWHNPNIAPFDGERL
ncbi:hypothetical protein FRB90_006546, partial [Tulasnella sp. 427]